MASISFTSSGFSAVVVLALLFYVLVYLPLTVTTKIIAHTKAKAARVRLLRQGTIIAEYEPPAGLSPAEMGYLFDGKLAEAEILGTLVALEQSGLWTIDRVGGSIQIRAFGLNTRPLDTYEQAIATYVYQQVGVGRVINRSILNKLSSLGAPLLKNRLREQGYLVSIYQQLKRSGLRVGLTILVLIVLFPFLTFRPTSVSGIITSIIAVIFLFPGYLTVAILLFFSYQKITGEQWLGTPLLKQIWPDIEGFREYILMVDLQQIQFESKASPQMVKDKNLPYAIALGLNTDWQKNV